MEVHFTEKPLEKIDVPIADRPTAPVRHKRPAAQKVAILNVIVIGLLFFFIAGWLLLGKRPTSSEIENRNLARFPAFSWSSYWNGEFTNAITNFYDDTVPGREWFKNISATLRLYMGIQTDDGVTLHGTFVPRAEEDDDSFIDDDDDDGDDSSQTDAPVKQTTPQPQTTTEAVTTVTSKGTSGTEKSGTTAPVTTAATTAPPPTTAVTTAAPPPPADDPNDEGELSNNILIYKNRGIMLFGGSMKNGRKYASYLNSYHADLGPNVNIYSMVIPTPCSYYTPDKFKKLIGSEINNINNINQNFSGVKPVDAYGALERHKDEPIFSRTDHHWQGLGAYYAAQEFAKTAGVGFRDLGTFQKVVKPGYVGTLYGYSGDIKLKNNPEDFIYYVPDTNYTTTYYNSDMSNARKGSLLVNIDKVKPVSWYMVYQGSDDRITHVETETKNGRTLCIVKDSYGNALAPFLTASFEHIYVIDMRYFKKNAIAFMKQQGVTDVLFAMNTFSATGSNFKKLETIRTQ